MEYECSWIGQGERLVDSRRKNGASKKEDNKYIPLETMIELGLIKLVQVSDQRSFPPFSTPLLSFESCLVPILVRPLNLSNHHSYIHTHTHTAM